MVPALPVCGNEQRLVVAYLAGTWLGFATVYHLLDRRDAAHFGFADGWADALYFSSTTGTGTGFGDYTPRTRLAKAVVVVQQLLSALGVVAFLCLVVRPRTAEKSPGPCHRCCRRTVT